MEADFMISVAIDGPSAAGKSTIARKVAERLGYVYIDTGAMYRSIALFAKENSIDSKDEKGVSSFLKDININIDFKCGKQLIILNGVDVSEKIRLNEISMLTSNISSIKAVRDFLIDRQRSLAQKYDLIMDGRDIATVVLPYADVKIFLTASVEARANRRFAELNAKGQKVDLSEIHKEIEKRDFQDMNRKIAPLRQDKDAILIDTSDLTLDDSINTVSDTILNKLKKNNRGRNL